AQLRLSVEVAQVVTSILDPDELIRRVARLITDRFGCYYAAVFTLDAAGKFAVLREATGEAGRLLKERGHKLEVGGRSMVGFVTAQRKPRIALNVGQEAVRFANPLLPDTRTEIALPLLAGDRVLGALDVQSTQEAAFDEASATMLQSMADQIAVALNNATSYAEAQAALAETEVLYGASHRLASARDLQEILAAATESVRVPDINRAALHLFERNAAGEIVASVVQANWYSGWGSPPATIGVRYATEEFLIVKLFAATEEPFFLDDALHDERVAPTTLAVLQDWNILAMAVLPLWAGAHRVGVLLLQADNPHHFRESEIRPYVSLAQQMGVAIENLRLSEQTRRALDELDAINRRLTGEAWAEFSHRAARRGVMWVSSDSTAEQKDFLEVAESLSSGRIVVRPGVSPNTLGVAVPILLRGTAIGALRLSVSEGIWTDELASVLEALTGHVAQAAENARLLETAKERAWREHALSESTEKVRRGTDVERILQTAAEELARHLKATRVAVRLGSSGEARSGGSLDGNGCAE
ncbi:MAG: GAF domain-containing protein, partial [Anaerolineae bacterium]